MSSQNQPSPKAKALKVVRHECLLPAYCYEHPLEAADVARDHVGVLREVGRDMTPKLNEAAQMILMAWLARKLDNTILSDAVEMIPDIGHHLLRQILSAKRTTYPDIDPDYLSESWRGALKAIMAPSPRYPSEILSVLLEQVRSRDDLDYLKEFLALAPVEYRIDLLQGCVWSLAKDHYWLASSFSAWAAANGYLRQPQE